MDRRRRRISAALVADRAEAAPAAGRQGRGVGAQSDRPFILAKLETAGLQPAPEADRRTLARRLSLDLTGLPPAPADVEAFVNDTVRRCLREVRRSTAGVAALGRASRPLLAGRRPLRRYARHPLRQLPRNLGVSRLGHRRVQRQHALRSIHHRATGRRPAAHRTLDQQVASGFNRCNITTNEGGAISEEYLVLYTRDRTETTSQVWLGLTAGCAVCHDHKFDPLTQREFYSMAAFFNNTTQAAMDGNIKDTPPIGAGAAYRRSARWELVSKELSDLRQKVEAPNNRLGPTSRSGSAGAKPEAVALSFPVAACDCTRN